MKTETLKTNTKTNSQNMKQSSQYVAQVLKTLAHPERLLILCYLTEKERSVNELVELCEISQSAVSQFLMRMKTEGLVSSARDGNFVRYQIKDTRIKKVLDTLYKNYCN